MATLPITILTSQAAQQDLQNDGTTISLSPRWAAAAVTAADYNPTALTLNIAAVHAPFRGILEYGFSPVQSLLTAPLSAAATSFTITAADGLKFPSPTGTGILLTLTKADGSKSEVVQSTARAGDTFTITRAAADTTAQAFAIGDKVALRLPSGSRTDSFSDASGTPLTGPSAIYRLHPQAALRLAALAAVRYAPPSTPLMLPIPAAMVIHGVKGFSSAQWYEADEAIPGTGGALSFHDARGLILDPIYVACLFNDLQIWLIGLKPKNPVLPSIAGGTQTIAALSSLTLVRAIDLHGAVFQTAVPGAALVTRNGGGTQTATLPANGLVTLAAGDGIDVSATGATPSDAGRWRWGWATNGTLARTRLVPPALLNPLAQQSTTSL